MSTLYELTGEYLTLLEMAEDPDMDPKVFRDTLEAMDGEIEAKADGYAMVMAELNAKVEALKAEIDRMTKIKRTCEKSVDRMKDALQASMEMTGKRKFKTDLFSFGIQRNKDRVVVDDWKLLPHDFLKVADPVPDKTAIYEALKDGFELNGAHLEQSMSLRIR